MLNRHVENAPVNGRSIRTLFNQLGMFRWIWNDMLMPIVNRSQVYCFSTRDLTVQHGFKSDEDAVKMLVNIFGRCPIVVEHG